MGAISIAVYVGFNYASNGIGIIGDAVIAIGLYIAFYYGLTGFTCAWYYRRNLTSSARNLWMQGILPATGGLILFFLGGWSVWLDYDVATQNSFTMWTVPGLDWQIGGAFVIAAVSTIVGILVFIYCRLVHPAFFNSFAAASFTLPATSSVLPFASSSLRCANAFASASQVT